MFLEELRRKDIVLASRSPRRKALLESLGINFRLEIPEVNEDFPEGLRAEEISIILAERKADYVLKTGNINKDSIIIASDTIVYLDKRILNKPSDSQEAFEMLKDLSGKSHEVITGVCLASEMARRSFFSKTKVNFTDLNEEDIWYYIDKYKPFDKAGSYGIQEWIGFIGVESIEVSYFNVMGLPVQHLYAELKEFIKE